MLRLISLLGISALLALAWRLSHHRCLFPWRTVLWSPQAMVAGLMVCALFASVAGGILG